MYVIAHHRITGTSYCTRGEEQDADRPPHWRLIVSAPGRDAATRFSLWWAESAEALERLLCHTAASWGPPSPRFRFPAAAGREATSTLRPSGRGHKFFRTSQEHPMGLSTTAEQHAVQSVKRAWVVRGEPTKRIAWHFELSVHTVQDYLDKVGGAGDHGS